MLQFSNCTNTAWEEITMGARPDFFRVKNHTIRVVSLVLIILLIIVAPAIGLQKEVMENTPVSPTASTPVPPPTSGWGSSIIILLGIGCAVGLAIYKITVSKVPADDWIPAKDRAMFEQLIAANNK